MPARNTQAIDRPFLLGALAAYLAGGMIMVAMLASTLLWPVLSGH